MSKLAEAPRPTPSSDVERARSTIARTTKARGDHAVIEDPSPRARAANGSRVVVRKGENITEDCRSTDRSLAGETARVDGTPYVAVGGPNRGKVIQPVRLEATGTIVGVPEDRLDTPDSRGHSRPSVGWSRRYEANFDAIFRRKQTA